MRFPCAVLMILAVTFAAAADDRFTGGAPLQAPAKEKSDKPAVKQKSDKKTTPEKPAAEKPVRRAATKPAKKNDDEAKAETAAASPPQEPSAALRERIGWHLIEDPVTHVRFGLPGKLVPKSAESKTGSRWTSAHGEVQIETFRVTGAGTTLAGVFEYQKKNPANRRVESGSLRADSFLLTGLQGLKNFHVHAQFKDGEVRGLTILHDQAWEGIMTPVVSAIWNALVPFPNYATAGISIPYRRKVEYGTGIIVSGKGYIVTDRLLADGCGIIVVAGHGNAERIRDDKTLDLALLRLYGENNLKPLALTSEMPKDAALTIIGIADPQAQAGGGAVTTTSGRLGNDGANTIEPSPALGFAGAAALDQQGRIVGLVSEKPSVVAGPPSAASRAALVPAATILKFLESEKIANTGGRSGIEAAKTGVVRVICVRN